MALLDAKWVLVAVPGPTPGTTVLTAYRDDNATLSAGARTLATDEGLSETLAVITDDVYNAKP